MSNVANSVELDPASVAKRLLEQEPVPLEGELMSLAPQKNETTRNRKRNLQLELLDTTSTQTSASGAKGNPLVQLYLLKNRQAIYDSNVYSQVQSVVIQDSFYSILGDRLKDYPPVLKKTPLISLQFFSQTFEKTTKIYNIKDMTKVQLTEMKIQKAGYIYCMILEKNAVMEKNIMGLHVKYGIDSDNKAAVWKRQYLVEDPDWIIYFNLEDLPIGDIGKNYTFYYYATDKRVGELVSVTPVKKIDFNIWKVAEVKQASLLAFSMILMLLSSFWIN